MSTTIVNKQWKGSHMHFLNLQVALAKAADIDFHADDLLANYTEKHSEGEWTEDELQTTDILMVFLLHGGLSGNISHKHLKPLACRIIDILDQKSYTPELLNLLCSIHQADKAKQDLFFDFSIFV